MLMSAMLGGAVNISRILNFVWQLFYQISIPAFKSPFMSTKALDWGCFSGWNPSGILLLDTGTSV